MAILSSKRLSSWPKAARKTVLWRLFSSVPHRFKIRKFVQNGKRSSRTRAVTSSLSSAPTLTTPTPTHPRTRSSCPARRATTRTTSNTPIIKRRATTSSLTRRPKTFKMNVMNTVRNPPIIHLTTTLAKTKTKTKCQVKSAEVSRREEATLRINSTRPLRPLQPALAPRAHHSWVERTRTVSPPP